ncbi:hypothetical protein MTR67_020915 [Solanum verrucosum]|uniref:Cytochrome P450 n=1 Tax=Solanum verrucosum TaxID=315347 RepID=A0AAF0QRZ6_SOLVR|nr:hypothetical protein MTR67_020915 [Solanum verrucosum]
MEIMLSLFDDAIDEDLDGFDVGTIIKSTCLAMLAGGSDTTVVAPNMDSLFVTQQPSYSTGSDCLARIGLFKPERFLTTHKGVDVKGNNFELIPFSSGRRSCPGISSALVLLHLTLANVLQAFEITRPSDEPIAVTERRELCNKKGKTRPKVAGSWPVIGHLHLFSGSNLPHKTFGLMADKYGPIFTVKFGAHQVLVVNDRKIAQDCFTTNDKAWQAGLKRWQ